MYVYSYMCIYLSPKYRVITFVIISTIPFGIKNVSNEEIQGFLLLCTKETFWDIFVEDTSRDMVIVQWVFVANLIDKRGEKYWNHYSYLYHFKSQG